MSLTPEQLAIRKGRITSSTAAACLGLSRWATPIDAWQAIRGESKADPNKAMERGTYLEPALLQWVAAKLDLKLQTTSTIVHPDHPWLAGTADALLRNGSTFHVVEGKTVGLGSEPDWGEEGTDQVPDEALVQSHIHLICWPEASRCAVPVIVGGYAFEFRLYWVNRDPKLEATLIERLHAWHQKHIVGGETPDPQAGDEEFIAGRHPRAIASKVTDGDTVDALERWGREYVETRSLLKVQETQKSLARTKIIELIEEHDSCQTDLISISYRNTKDRTHTDWRAIAEEAGAPETLIQKHTRVAPGHRTLRVTPRKPKAKTE